MRLARPHRPSLIWSLSFGAFGLAFSITTTAAYLPPLLERFTDSRTVIGGVIAAEGIFALALSLVIGPWSDHFHTPIGRRRPFMLAALAPLGAALLLMGLMPNLWTTIVIVVGFYIAYYVYEPPYRGLYPDLLDQSHFGRAQSVQHLMRGTALGVALIAGSQLFHVWHAAPFLLAALVTTAACGATVSLVDEGLGHGEMVYKGVRSSLSTSWSILREEPEVRKWLIANAAWEGTFAAARTFVVLYITKGLREDAAVATGVFACVAAGYVVAAVFSGRIGDRIGIARVIFVCTWVYSGGLIVAGLARHWHAYYFGLIFPVSVAAGAVMTLSWGLLFKLMPARHRGAIAGLALGTKGIGLLFALVTGAAIDALSGVFRSTDGYQALWPICAIPILISIPLVAGLIRVETPSGRPEPLPG